MKSFDYPEFPSEVGHWLFTKSDRELARLRGDMAERMDEISGDHPEFRLLEALDRVIEGYVREKREFFARGV